MQVEFLKDFNLEIVTGLEIGQPQSENEEFRRGEIIELELSDGKNIPESNEVEFINGCIAIVNNSFWESVRVVDGFIPASVGV